MFTMTSFYSALDPLLIWTFRLTDNPYIGFAIGLGFIALVATVIGELCMAGVYFLNKKHFASLTKQMVTNNNLSIRALGVGDKASYTACNAMANDAFGKNFFAQLALFASSVWPAALALGWLEFRFGRVDFVVPLAGDVSPAFFFVPTYVLVRILFNKSKPWLPLFKTIRQKIRENENSEEMLSFLALMREDGEKGQGGAMDAAKG